MARAQEERAGADGRAKQAARERDAAAEERSSASKARQSVQTELNLRAGDEQEVRDRVAHQHDRARELEDSLQHQAERARSLAGENEALERDLGDLRTQVQEAEQRRKDNQQRWGAEALTSRLQFLPRFSTPPSYGSGPTSTAS